MVKPRILKGFKDYSAAEVAARCEMIATIRAVFERYGFSPLETPAIEYLETLLGHGEDSNKQIYRFEDCDENAVGLRFDLTVPLARFIAMNKELPRPFKRYQVAPVWRADKPDPGRFREFLQFDIDTVGSKSSVADAELIAAVADALSALGICRFKVRYSSRKLLQSLMFFAKIDPAKAADVFRILDKREKQGIDAVRLELTVGRVDKSGDRIPGLGLDPASVAKVEEFLMLPQTTRKEAVASLERFFAPIPEAAEPIAEIAAIDRLLTAMGKGDDIASIDLSIARGLDYYTGPVFETTLLDLPAFGSIASGGRYDNLVRRFINEDIPASGISIGIDRLFAALVELKAIRLKPTPTQVLVTVFDETLMDEYQRMTSELRASGVNTMLYLGNQKSIGKQLQYADRAGIPIALIMGSDERGRGEVTVKDLRVLEQRQPETATKDRKDWLGERVGQKSIRRDTLVSEVRKVIGECASDPTNPSL